MIAASLHIAARSKVSWGMQREERRLIICLALLRRRSHDLHPTLLPLESAERRL